MSLAAASPGRAEDSSLSELRRNAAASRDDAAAQLALGHALINAGRFAEAEQQMARYVRASHGSLESLYAAAGVPLAQGDSKRARVACQKLAAKNPRDVLTHVCVGRAFLVWRRATRAEEHVQAAIATNPNHPEALLALADLKRIESDVRQARGLYERVIEQAPDRADARLGLGLTLALLGEPKAALEALRTAHRLDPSDPLIAFELGRRLPVAEGVPLLETAVAARPQWTEAELALSQAKLSSGDAHGAAKQLEQLLVRDGNNGAARAQHGLALIEQGKLREAEVELRKAVSLVPTDYESSLALARLYERSGRNEDAFEQYRHTADLKHESATPLIAAAQLGLSLKRPVFAGALLQRALERAPTSAKALALYGDSLAARNDAAGAKSYYERALKGDGEVDREAIRRAIAALK
jgi:tetratricopeptide (TPR) repeat protein